jgi:hypothetical protein
MFNALRTRIALAAFLLPAISVPAHAANLLTNGNMQTPTPGIPPGTPVSLTAPPGGSTETPNSAADQWLMYMHDAGTITTELVPTTFPRAPAGWMMHVTVNELNTDAYGSGIWQWLPKVYPGFYFTCAWIYINHGAVGIGSGLAAYTEVSATLDRQGSWEVLNVRGQNGGGPSSTNLALIYAMPSINDPNAGTDFYVQTVSLSTSQSQCKPY